MSTGDAASHRTTSTVGTAAAGKGAGNRSISTTTYPHLTELVKQGFLPPRSDLLWLPEDKIEDVPKPDSWNRVIHTSFLYRGLSLPLHSFVRGLLVFYGCQLHCITPNGVLYLACFIPMCECFLGISPHFWLWHYLFKGKMQMEDDAVPYYREAVVYVCLHYTYRRRRLITLCLSLMLQCFQIANHIIHVVVSSGGCLSKLWHK